MQLLLIRHGLPVPIEGHADPELDEIGHAQSQHLAEYLASERIDVIYTSPMHRARQTAAPLAERLGMEPIVEPDVAESDKDGTSYVPVEQLKAAGDPRWREAVAVSDWAEEREPLDAFHERVMAGIERMVDAHAGQNVAVFCHGGVIARYTATILELPWERTGFFYPLYTSVTRVAASSSSGIRSILTVNETAHLRGTGLPTGAL
ncbi:MAG: histidine phosphatase family protein [Acidimicrobiales bacterium]